MLYDITRTIAPDTYVWPEVASPSITRVLKLTDGASVNLTTLQLSPHTGTHADSYYHYEPDGDFAATMPLEVYIGHARLVTVAKQDGPLFPEDFAHVSLVGAERLLIHSSVSNQADNEWPPIFPYLSVPLIEWLASLDIRLIGLDSPSVDALDSTELMCHHALYRYRMVNIENLFLRGVPDGDYELIALPLKLDLACASPVRAVLRTL
ncbi:MAG: cyclase family protein [Chloroflexota bacterium]